MDVGVGVVNVASIRKLELYGGSVVPSATDSGYAITQPVEELALGQQNFLAGAQQPLVHQF